MKYKLVLVDDQYYGVSYGILIKNYEQVGKEQFSIKFKRDTCNINKWVSKTTWAVATVTKTVGLVKYLTIVDERK